jgi:hypothetical protein
MLHETIVAFYSSALKMQTARSSETPVNFYQTRRHIQENGSLHSHLLETLSCETFDI